MKTDAKHLTSRFEKLMTERDSLLSDVAIQSQKIAELMQDRRKLQQTSSEWKVKATDSNSKQKEILQRKDDEIIRQWLRIKELEKSNGDLQKIIEAVDDQRLELKDNGRFSNEIRQVVMKLHGLNLSSRSICPAIKTVLEGLTNVTVDCLPSYGTVNKMLYEAKCLALLNAERESLKDKEETEPANFLLSDRTYKLKKHYNTTIISTSTGERTIGMQLLSAENSENLMKVTRESFEEVADILSRVDGKSKDQYVKDLLLSLKGTMSDRCEVMKKFNRLFEEYRDSILGASQLSEEEKGRWQKLQNHKFR